MLLTGVLPGCCLPGCKEIASCAHNMREKCCPRLAEEYSAVTAAFWHVQVVNGAELNSNIKYESEQAVRGVFVAARALVPSVLLLDECDTFAPARQGMASGISTGSSQGASGAGMRVLGTLMHEMDELGELMGDAAYALFSSLQL